LRKALDSIPSTTRGKDGVILINQGWFNIRKYRAGGMAQVVENLPSKLKALRWLTPIILPTQEAESRRIMVRSQPGQMVRETLS
jgi:hypothetical protein